MSRRSRIKKYPVFETADTATSPVSKETDISGVDYVIYEIAVDPTVNASLAVKFDNSDTFNASTAKPLDFAQVTPLNGSSEANYMVVVENKGFKWIALELTNTGGTGNINAWVSGTVRGA